MGRCKEREHKTLPVLAPYATIQYHLTLGIADGKQEMDAIERLASEAR
jgi:hypothetical protein